MHFSHLVQENFGHKISIKIIHKFLNFEISLYNIYENIPEASNLEIFENEIEIDELEKPAIFALDEKYLTKIFDKLYIEDTSEMDSISTDDDNDLISESCSEELIIEQKESKILTHCVIQIDGESIVEVD
ncbi:13746_t:CDS:2, partial [Funneliformis mosseae]